MECILPKFGLHIPDIKILSRRIYDAHKINLTGKYKINFVRDPSINWWGYYILLNLSVKIFKYQWPIRLSNTKQAHLLGSAWFCSESWLPGPLVWLEGVSMSVLSKHRRALIAALGMWGTAGEHFDTEPHDNLYLMSPLRLMYIVGRPARKK